MLTHIASRIKKHFSLALILFSSHSLAAPDINTTHSWIKKHLNANSINRISGNWLPDGLVAFDLALKGDWEFFEKPDDECSLVITSTMRFYKGEKLVNLENFPYQKYPQYISFLADYARETHYVVRFPSDLELKIVGPHTERLDDSQALHENFSLQIKSTTVRFLNVKNVEELMNNESAERIWEERRIKTNTFSIPLRSEGDVDRLKKALVNLNEQCLKIENAF